MAGVARQDGLTFYLEVTGPDQDGGRYEVGPDGLLVGRSSACDVVFESREVSRRHAYFYPADDACCVKDLGSKNGTIVNGQRARETQLCDGDVADVGPNRFVLRAEGPGQRSRAVPAAGAAEQAAAAADRGHPLALAALVFGALSYVHWAFGTGGVVLALVSLWEIRRGVHRSGRALAVGGLVLGLCGGLLNAWFVEVVPPRRVEEERAARLACGEKIARIGDALREYRAARGGAFPARLGDLVDEGLLRPDDLECPGRRLDGPGPATYLFLRPRGPRLGGPFQVIAADGDPAYHQGEGGWILRDDGRAEWLAGDRFAEVLARATEVRREPPPAAAAPEGPGP